ncbi:hypothetical protein BDW66DRAFT_129519 [Aspergillus desertorum]
MVLQELWALAELTHPQASSVDYYRRIFELLNEQSDTCDSAVPIHRCGTLAEALLAEFRSIHCTCQPQLCDPTSADEGSPPFGL